jgi:FKBP-type peptidyl-prolyl cis-trans isomerase
MLSINMLSKLKYFLLILTSLLAFSACNEDEYADWKILNDKYMSDLVSKIENDTQGEYDDFHVTESGICYQVIHQGIMRFPNASSVVKVNYTGTMIDGTVFDSGTYFNYLSGTIEGWQEILPKMSGGAHFKVYIPADLAYGTDGSTVIPPYSTLIFDIYLVESFN